MSIDIEPHEKGGIVTETKLLPAQNPETPALAAELIQNGNLVAIPTETVYGLGANGLDEEAVAKIFVAKGRPQDNPLILHVAEAKDMERFCHHIPATAYALAEAFWPGPLTIVLPAKDNVPKRTTGGLSTVAIRCPDNDVTRQIIRLAGVPIAAPSAILSGMPSTTTAQHVLHDHAGNIPAIVDDGPCRVGVESTIVDLTEDVPRLLRPGGITPQEIMEIIGSPLVIDKAVASSVEHDAVVKAPGMKYRHYAPACKVLIVDGDLPAAYEYIRTHFQPGNRVLCFEEELEIFSDFHPLAYGKRADPDTLLSGLFSALRELDDETIGTVFARCPRGDGKALAVQNRLGKAAAFCHINPRKHSFILGITGGSGCGKTTLLDTIASLGGTVIDCDAVYHRLLKHDASLLEAIANRFPNTVKNGTLDRKALGNLVFHNPEELKALNAITHPAVKAEVLRCFPPIPSFIAIDAIGLFEGDLSSLCDATVAVLAPKESRIQRLMRRESISREYAEKRIAAQNEDAWYRENCDYVLINDGTLEEFQGKCIAFCSDVSIMKEK